ncbi:MAG: diguanylate cyclase [Bacillus subtilis]|nr:diguanylate cyclase [Bacillus subtilis]
MLAILIVIFVVMSLATVYMLMKIRKSINASSLGISLREAIDASREGMWEWNVETGNITASDYWYQMHGYQPNEIDAITYDVWIALVHPDDILRITEERAKATLERRDFVEVVYRIMHKQGHWIWISSRAKIVEWTDEFQPKKIIGMNLDVTAAMTKEREMNDYHHIMKFVIDHTKSGVAVFDTGMRHIYLSHRFCEMYGVKQDEVLGKNHYEVFPDLPEKWREVHRRTLRGEICFADRDPYVRADGTTDITRWETRPWRNQSGEIAGIVLYSEVINDMIKHERELEESKNFLMLVMDHLPIGISVNTVEPAVEFQYMNNRFPELYGTTRETLSQPDAFWTAVYEDEQFRTEIKQRVLTDIASNDPNRSSWLNIPLTRKGLPTRYISAYDTRVPKSNVLISTVLDVTEQNRKIAEVEYAGNHDYLTGLFNRRYFSTILETYYSSQKFPIALIMMDLNGLKLFNDAFGHLGGDEVLKRVANVLQKNTVDYGLPCRIGGDEFAVLLTGKTEKQVEALKDMIYLDISNEIYSNIPISIAAGYAVQTTPGDSMDELIKTAEQNMFKKKILDGRSSRNNAINGIIQTLAEKYNVEKVHSEKVSNLCRQMGIALEKSEDEVREMELAGLLHDIGKITTPDAILTKPGKLTENEYEIIKTHTSRGYQILRTADEYSDLAVYALTHHERYDGKGYPNGLKGDEIPLISRIISISDAFEAMTADRPYRAKLTDDEAAKELNHHAGTQFDPFLVGVFVQKVLRK